MAQAPNQTRSEKTVIKTLILRENFRSLGLFEPQAKGTQSNWLGPKEHLEHQNPHVKTGDNYNQSVSCHRLFSASSRKGLTHQRYQKERRTFWFLVYFALSRM